MEEKANRPHQSTFDQGRITSLELAMATFLRMQQEVPLNLFIEMYEENVKTWDDTTLGMTVKDEYRKGVEDGSRGLLSLLSRSDRDPA
ncbi:hypothetical protein [Comamonas sp.]|uniref:hypothetical protein n=1 Tax=Comamonas sp. TaxID=34028 RepID=UPI003A930C4D